jgi:ATP-dependent helicase/nuclease subunit B
VQFARQVDRADPAPPYPRPQPVPSAAQRRVKISATQLDRLRGDPYQFYASKILRLSALDPIDAEPSAAEKGTAAHAVLDKWQQDGARIERLGHFVDVELTRFAAHPLVAALWRPRLENVLRWIAERVVTDRAEGRLVLATEAKGEMAVRGITFSGVADRIDRTAGGHLAIVDYKSGMPPSSRQVEEGFALQLGTLGLIAAAGGFPNVGGEPDTFEYWSLGRDTKRDGFGYITTPLKIGGKRSGIPPDDFLPESERYLHDALDRWILGDDPFTARLNPDLGGFNDFDQLMRLDEWLFDLLPGDAG